MSNIAISVQQLGKQYTIGEKQPPYQTLRDSLSRAANRLFSPQHTASTRSFWALQNINFEINQGDVVGIIGKNGAGKSTLLKILSRITEPTLGSVDLYGKVGSLLEVGTGFHPELTGRENIFLNGAILGMHQIEIKQKLDEIIAFAEIEPFIDTPVKHYSSGMYLRLAFSVAAHLEPEILLVDEVLAVGDLAFQKKCLGKMSAVAKQGRTILFVSHDMTSISVLCPTAILLEKGQINKQGPTLEVIADYLKSSTSENAVTRWDEQTAPGNQQVRLILVQACLNGQNKPQENFFIEQSISLQLSFKVTAGAKKPRLNPVFRVRNLTGLTIFTTANYDDPSWGKKKYENGNYHVSCKIPAHLFNDGTYLIDVLLVHESREVWAEAEGAIRFSVADNGSTRGDYVGDWHGAVRPYCTWNGEKIN